MDYFSRVSIMVLFGCLIYVLYDLRTPQSLSEQQIAQVQEIVNNAIQGYEYGGDDFSALEQKVTRELKLKEEAEILKTKKENIEKLVLAGMRIASDAQAWLRKPTQFGGGSKVNKDGTRSKSFEGISIDKLGYPTDEAGRYTSLNGICEIQVGNPTTKLNVYCSNRSLGTLIHVAVSGPRVDDIETQIMKAKK